MTTAVEKALLVFLRDRAATCFGLVGEVGAGKLYTIQKIARREAWSIRVVDRSQSAIDYKRFGQLTLGGNGLIACLFAICNAKEVNWDFLHALNGKFVFIANDEHDLTPLKRANFRVERQRRPTVEEQTKSLFLDHGVPVTKAKRLSRLAQGDWRRIWTLDQLFRDAGIDLESVCEQTFEEALATMAKDAIVDAHPSLKVHRLFHDANGNGRALDQVDFETLLWSHANLDVVCDNLGDMLLVAESAATSDVLTAEGEALGLDHFARTALSVASGSVGYYDYKRFRNPYTKNAKSVEAIQKSYDGTRSTSWHLKRKPRENNSGDEAPPQKRPRGKAKAKTKATSKTTRATTTAAAKGRASKLQR